MDFEKDYGIKLKCNYFAVVPIELGITFGVTDSMVIMQVLYWMKKFENNPDHNKDGRVWVYNTYNDWIKMNFPYLSRNTVIRAFERLEKKGIILSANYNKRKFDKTKWYTVDIEKLNEVLKGVQVEQNIYPKWVEGIPKMSRADTQNEKTNTITYTNNTSKNNSIGVYCQSQDAENPHPDSDVEESPFDFKIVERQFRKACKELCVENEDEVLYVVRKFYQCWYQTFGGYEEEPRRLSQREVMQCVENMWIAEDENGCSYDISIEDYDDIIERYFETDFQKECDYSLSHFLSGRIRFLKLYETGNA